MKAYDSRAWVVWLLAGALLSVLIRNPVYLLILLAVSRLTAGICGASGSPVARFGFWRLSISILLFSTLFNMLSAHSGATVLARLPSSWWFIGGDLTAEAAVYGFVSGLSLVTILSFFMAFNAIVPVSQLARMTPRALHEMGLVLLVSVTYLPELSRQWQRIRDAQAIRGHRVRTLIDWRPLALPLLVGGLERSMNLAETMVTRGFASVEPRPTDRRAKYLMLFGLVCLFAGVLVLAWGREFGWAALALGAAAIVAGYRLAGRGFPSTRYSTRPWAAVDTLVALMAIAPVLLATVPLGLIDRATLAYSPYPVLAPPSVDVGFAAALLCLLFPALWELMR